MRTEHEEENLGGYERIFPTTDEERMKTYKNIMIKAKSLWIESTSGGSNK